MNPPNLLPASVVIRVRVGPLLSHKLWNLAAEKPTPGSVAFKSLVTYALKTLPLKRFLTNYLSSLVVSTAELSKACSLKG